MHIAQLYCIGWAIVTALSVCPSAAFRYCAKTVLARAMKFGSIMESHTLIPYPLLVLGYDDPKGSKNPKTQKRPQQIQRYKHKDIPATHLSSLVLLLEIIVKEAKLSRCIGGL